MDDYISGWQDWTHAFADWHDVTISELHGLVSGIASVCDAPSEQVWQALLAELSFGELDAGASLLLTEEVQDLVAMLSDEEDSYQFLPLVPDDDHPLYERLMALKNWANGYLTGFGVTDSALRPEETSLFNDLAKIGALRVDEFDEALQGTHNPEGEVHYMELLEFVRMVPVSVAQGRVRKSVEKLPLIAGFAMHAPIGQGLSNEHEQRLDFIEGLAVDSGVADAFEDELQWQAEKDANDDFFTHMVIDAMTGKRPS